jgi:hypothetical protein
MSGGAAQYNLTIDWQGIRRMVASSGLVDVDLTDNRSLRFDRLNLTFSQPPNALFSVTEPNNVTLLQTDWQNTRRVEVVGDALRVTVDDLRGVVERRGRVLRTLETREATMHALWQDTTQTLFLPQAEDFIAIDTPAAIPAYDPDLRPREVNEETGVVGFRPGVLPRQHRVRF